MAPLFLKTKASVGGSRIHNTTCVLAHLCRYFQLVLHSVGTKMLLTTRDSDESLQSDVVSFTSNVPLVNHRPTRRIMTRIAAVQAVFPAPVRTTEIKRSDPRGSRGRLRDQRRVERKFLTTNDIMRSAFMFASFEKVVNEPKLCLRRTVPSR